MVNLNWKTVVAIGAVGLVVLFVLERQAKAAAGAVGDALNPVSDQNIFYQGADALSQATTGGSVDQLLTPVFNFFTGNNVQ